MYTVIMLQVMKGTKYFIGSKTMDQAHLDQLVKGGATLLYRDIKYPKLVTIMLN